MRISVAVYSPLVSGQIVYLNIIYHVIMPLLFYVDKDYKETPENERSISRIVCVNTSLMHESRG